MCQHKNVRTKRPLLGPVVLVNSDLRGLPELITTDSFLAGGVLVIKLYALATTISNEK